MEALFFRINLFCRLCDENKENVRQISGIDKTRATPKWQQKQRQGKLSPAAAEQSSEIQIIAQRDVFITKISMLSVTANVGLLLDSRYATSFHSRCILGTRNWSPAGKPVSRQSYQKPSSRTWTKRLQRVINQFSTCKNTAKGVKVSNFAGSYQSILLTQYSM